MSQQINLVNVALRKQKDILSSASLVRVTGGFLALLCLISGYLLWVTRGIEIERAEWRGRAEAAKVEMAQVLQKFPPRQPSPVLQVDIKNTEDKIRLRDRVFDVLKSGAVGQPQGFAGILQAFARQGMKGLWITGVAVNGAGDQMRIAGNALSADLIPQYITRLSSEQALRGRSFTALQVSQPKPVAPVAGVPSAAVAPAYVEFALSADKAAAANPSAEVKP